MQVESHGVYPTRQLHELGLSRSQLRTAARRGQLVRMRTGWWARPDADARVVAAVAAGGVLSCVSALRLHGVWVPAGDAVHIRLARGARRLSTRYCLPFGPNIPLSGAVDDVRTSVLCAVRCLDPEGAVVVLDSVLNLGHATVEDLREWLSTCPQKVKDLLARCDLAEAGTESMVRLRLRSLGIRVRPQAWITAHMRVDLLIGDRLIVECDSVEHHTSSAAYEADRRRDRELMAMGYRVIRLTYRQIHEEWPAIEQSLLTIIRAGQHRWPRRRFEAR